MRVWTTKYGMRNARGSGGFTIIEILVALAILGTGLVMLLETHYGALQLFVTADDEALMRSMMELALGEAEVSVMTGKFSGSGDFGKRYPDYSFSFTGENIFSDLPVALYEIEVTVKGPDESRSMLMSAIDTRSP